VSSRPRTIASKKVASHCAQAFTGVHASEGTFHFPVAPRLGNGAPELGTADFTEVGGLHRGPQGPKFPKDAAERDCYRYLLGQMQATPDRPHQRKAEFEEICRGRFYVTVESFDYLPRPVGSPAPVGISLGARHAKAFPVKPPREFFFM
jgi:hypothetical protein